MKLKYPDVTNLSGLELERFVAAIFQSQGYYVERNLRWPEPRVGNQEQSVDILEVDILARYFSPFWESRILVECKGGCNFNDLFKFIGITKVIKPDAAFLICSNSPNFTEISKVGKENGIVVIRPEDMISKFDIEQQNKDLLNWYWINQIEDSFLDRERIAHMLNYPRPKFSKSENEAFSEIKRYNSVIKGEYWKTTDARDQSSIITTLFFEQKDFIRKIARIQGENIDNTENAIAQNIFCESAASIVLRARISYLVAALRCSILSLISTEDNYLDEITDNSFKEVVKKMTNSISVACRLPSFIQYWIYHWGGVLDNSDDELIIMAEQFGERPETIKGFLDLLDEIFSVSTAFGKIDWGVFKTSDFFQFKAIPDSISGFGSFTRTEHNISVEKYPYSFQWNERLQKVLKSII